VTVTATSTTEAPRILPETGHRGGNGNAALALGAALLLLGGALLARHLRARYRL
jgi:hypothetical protein